MNVYIETERLILRNLRLSDASDYFEMDSDPEVHKYLGNRQLTKPEEATRDIGYIMSQYRNNGTGRLAVELKSNSEVIGWCGIKFVNDYTINNSTNYYDLGYRFKRKHWGKGYGFESARAALPLAQKIQGCKKLIGTAMKDNLGSRRILEKLDFVHRDTFVLDSKECYWFERVL